MARKIIKTVTTTTTTTEEVEPKVIETHYLLILDKSGSMSSVRDVTISGFNEQIQTMKNLSKKYDNQKYFASLITFNNEVTENFIDKSIEDIEEIDTKSYQPNGGTALLDAMGYGITRLEDKLSPAMEDKEKFVTAVVVIMTDGEENSSTKWNQAKVKAMCERLSKNVRWTITYIGANQDAILAGKNYGIPYMNTSSYMSSSKGTTVVSNTLGNMMSSRAAVYANTSYSDIVGGGVSNTMFFASVGNEMGETVINPPIINPPVDTTQTEDKENKNPKDKK